MFLFFHLKYWYVKMETFLQEGVFLYAVIFRCSGSLFKFLVKRQEIDMVKMASNLMGGDLVWAVENSGQTLVWKSGRNLYLYLVCTKQLNGKIVICSGVPLSCKKKEKV